MNRTATRVLHLLLATALAFAGLALAPRPQVASAEPGCGNLAEQLVDLATFRVRTTVKKADGTLAPPRTTGALPLGLAVVPTDRGGLLHVTLTPPVLPPDGTILPATATVTKVLPLGALPVRVELLLDLPCGATVIVGYDGTESRAPVAWNASVAFSSGAVTTGDITLSTLVPGPNLTTIAALSMPGLSDTTASLRLAPVPARFGMAFTTDEATYRTSVELTSSLATVAAATVDDSRPGRTVHADATVTSLPVTDAAPVSIDVIADPAGHVDVRYGAPQRVALVNVNATVEEAGDSVTAHGLVEDVPDGFAAVADLPDGATPTVTWDATGRLGHLDATVDVTPTDEPRSQARIDVVDLPPHLAITGIATAGELTGAEVTLNEPVERVEGGFARGQDVVLGTDVPDIEPYVRHDADPATGSSSVAARLLGVSRARLNAADPVAVDVAMTPGDLRLIVNRPGELDVRGTIAGYPDRMVFEFSPDTRTLRTDSSGAIDRIDVVVNSEAPLFGRVHHARLFVLELPPVLNLTLGVADEGEPSPALVVDEPPTDCLPGDDSCGSDGGGNGGDGGGGSDGGGGGSTAPADPEPAPLITFDAHGQRVGQLSVVLASSANDVDGTPLDDGFILVDTFRAFVMRAQIHGLRTAEVRTGSFRGTSDTQRVVELVLDAPGGENPDGTKRRRDLRLDLRNDLSRTVVEVDNRPDSITSLRLDRNVVFLTDAEHGIIEAPVAQRLHYEATSAAGRTTLTSRPVRDDGVLSQEGLSLVVDSLPNELDFCFASSRRCTEIAIDDALRSLTFTAAAPVHLTMTACDALRCQPCVLVPCDPDLEVGKFVHADLTAQVVRAQVAPPLKEPVRQNGHLFLDTDGLPLTGTFNIHDPNGESLRDLVIHLPVGEPDGDPPSFGADDYLIEFEVNPLNATDGAVNVTSEAGQITCPAGTIATIRVVVANIIEPIVVGANLQPELCLGDQR